MTYELADFNPESGHLHTCDAWPGQCTCIGHLYAVAQDTERALADATRPRYTASCGTCAWTTDHPTAVHAAVALRVHNPNHVGGVRPITKEQNP